MLSYVYVAIVTLLALLTYAWMGTRVSAARGKAGIRPPAMTGDPLLERTIRAHYNTLEWLPIFLPSLWLFAIYWNSTAAAIIGLIWIVGRIIYFLGYTTEASKRGTGFLIQVLATAALLFGALGRLVYLAATGAN
jgi:glutathione S-transferase